MKRVGTFEEFIKPNNIKIKNGLWFKFKEIFKRISNFGMNLKDIQIPKDDLYKLSISYAPTTESVTGIENFKLELLRHDLQWQTFSDEYRSFGYKFNIAVKMEDKDKLMKLYNDFFNQEKIPAFENFRK